ncbi:MAG TPA: glycerophosphodiester phosphodiesterase [Myxococcaceae bacterium]|nr:glycerophosphodiester phosphodiesterase [Myxococcaceae bacterium]
MNVHPFLAGLPRTAFIAHRGGAGAKPENTLLAFVNALTYCGADILEMDVHLTADGVLVVSHDDTVDRCTDGQGSISGMTLRDLKQLDAGYRFTTDGQEFPYRGVGIKIPTFEEVLDAFPDARLNVEVKPDVQGLEIHFASLIRRKDAPRRLCCGSENDAVAERLSEALPEACHFYPRGALTTFAEYVWSGREPPRDDRFSVAEMPLYLGDQRLSQGALANALRRRNKPLFVWVVDDPDELGRLYGEGVEGVMTDRPDVLAKLLGSRALAGP